MAAQKAFSNRQYFLYDVLTDLDDILRRLEESQREASIPDPRMPEGTRGLRHGRVPMDADQIEEDERIHVRVTTVFDGVMDIDDAVKRQWQIDNWGSYLG